MKRINNQVFIIVCCFMFFSLAASLSEAAETQLRKLRVAITSLSGIDGGAMAGARRGHF